jgi:hypothetical protein
MKSAFVLQHSYEVDGNDETKFIGVYATYELAEEAILRLRTQPGFRDRPEDFHISEYEINKDHWVEGYAVMTTIQVKDKNNKWTTVQAEYLKHNTYQIIELYDNDSLGEFKHLDIVECEERDSNLFASKLITKHS